MPTNSETMNDLLAPFQPTRPLEDLVVEVNTLYHDHEAAVYDDRHPEVHRQLPEKWAQMVAQAGASAGPRSWTILDFGCGTGFEAEQLLRRLPAESVERLVCYDPSEGMLDRCEARIRPLCPDASFVSDPALLRGERFNLLATNSLLHHLPNPIASLTELSEHLTRDAYWLAGHEPSSRFYMNRTLVAALEQFEAERRWRRLLEPSKYVNRVGSLLGLRPDPLRRTAKAAVEDGLFRRLPSPLAIDRLVDYHVAHSPAEARAERGFDLLAMQERLQAAWRLVWHRSYSFMGPHFEGALPQKWSTRVAELARQYPDDGANVCAVWRRVA